MRSSFIILNIEHYMPVVKYIKQVGEHGEEGRRRGGRKEKGRKEGEGEEGGRKGGRKEKGRKEGEGEEGRRMGGKECGNIATDELDYRNIQDNIRRQVNQVTWSQIINQN